MRFTKMQGLGNDYIYINGFKETIDNPAELSIKLSNRHFGIGSDGLILILPSDKADFRMRMFNADGSEGKMCGNGIRCVGKYVYDKGLTQKKEVSVETLAGIRNLTLYTGSDNKVERVRVWMGIPAFSDLEDISDLPSKDFPTPITALDKTFPFYCVSMGNPHAVTIIQDVANFPIDKYGAVVQANSLFPQQVNVEFVELVSDQKIKMRVYERGSGETLACGTGACASAAAMMRLGHIKRKADVELLGGTLEIEWLEDGILMTGPATHVFDGEIAL